MIAPPERFRSFGQLARALLADPSWPPDMKIRERSLATLLSKLDREQDLAWLGDRPDVQAILARILKCSVRDLARPPSADPEGPMRKLRWADLPYARSFDLTEERLPPTVPPEVADPARWERTFWVAPSGAGRSLTGHWLAARGLAHFRSVEQLGELRGALGEDAPLFVELSSARAAVGAAPPARRLCVAGAVPPPPHAGWRIVHTPAIDAHLPELVRWLLARFPSDTGLDEDSLLAWLRSGPVPSGEADGFGAVLGLAGVLDRVGLGRARGKSVLELARLDARRRFDESFGAEARDVAWQRRNAIDVLVAMARRALTDDTEPFGAPRTLEEWTALVPDEHKSGVDVEWLRVSLSRVDSSIRPGDVERAARRLSPGAFRIVRALSGAGFLVPSQGERLVPAPRWISRAVELEAQRQLLGGSAFEWGEALLNPHAAPQVAAKLFDRLRSGDSVVLSDVVELEAGESPAYAVAVETAFRCAGLAMLAGAELDNEQLAELWDAAEDLWLRLGDSPPLPRVEHPPGLGALLERGAFFLAALCIGEALERPWPSHDPRPAYDAIAEALAHAEGAPWVSGAYALVDRRRRALGSVGHALEEPGLLLARVGTEELDWERVRSLDPDVLSALWRGREAADPEPLALALYRAWERAGFPELGGSVLDPRSKAGRDFFGHAPPELALRVLEASEAARETLLPVVPSELWRLLADSPAADRALIAALAAALPEAWVERWLAQPALRAHVWRRHHRAALERLLRDAREGEVESVIALAEGAPPEELEPALEALSAREELGRLGPPARAALESWLHRLVGARQRGWRAAYSFLARLEA